MTAHWGDQNPFGLGLSGTGLMGTGPDEAEMTLLQRVRDALKRLPATSSSDEGDEAA